MKNRGRIVRNLIVGSFGAGLLAFSEWLLFSIGDLKPGKGLILRAWAGFSFWRIWGGILLAAVGMPFFYIGIKSTVPVIRFAARRGSVADFRMTKLFECGVTATAVSFLFLHVGYTVFPVLYKALFSTSLMGEDITVVLNTLAYYLGVPGGVYLILAVVGVSVPYMYWAGKGHFRMPAVCMLLNPLVFIFVGFLMTLFHVAVLTDVVMAFPAIGYLLMFLALSGHVEKLPTEAEIRRRRAARARRRQREL